MKTLKLKYKKSKNGFVPIQEIKLKNSFVTKEEINHKEDLSDQLKLNEKKEKVKIYFRELFPSIPIGEKSIDLVGIINDISIDNILENYYKHKIKSI